MLRRIVCGLCWVFLGSLTAAERADLAIVEKVGGAVSFYTMGGRELGRVKVGAFPHEAVLSKDGKRLYVSNNGVLWMTEDSMGGNTVSVIDVEGMKKLYDIDLGKFHRPHGIELLPASNYLVATTERPFGLITIDPAARKVVRDGLHGRIPPLDGDHPGRHPSIGSGDPGVPRDGGSDPGHS